jgi:hypothetical protein
VRFVFFELLQRDFGDVNSVASLILRVQSETKGCQVRESVTKVLEKCFGWWYCIMNYITKYSIAHDTRTTAPGEISSIPFVPIISRHPLTINTLALLSHISVRANARRISSVSWSETCGLYPCRYFSTPLGTKLLFPNHRILG